jgi:hypothetical protein
MTLQTVAVVQDQAQCDQLFIRKIRRLWRLTSGVCTYGLTEPRQKRPIHWGGVLPRCRHIVDAGINEGEQAADRQPEQQHDLHY